MKGLFCKLIGENRYAKLCLKRIGAVLLTASAALCAGAEVFTLPLWPEGAPNESGIPAEAEKGDSRWIDQTVSAELTIYTPDQPCGIAIVCLPGGGYWGVAIGHEGNDMAEWMNRLGVTFCVLKYRMPGGHCEVPSSDSWRAIEYVREHAEELHVDPNKIGIMGSSAGGHLAATTACLYPSDQAKPDFQILFYPVISMDEKITHAGSREQLLGSNPSQESIDKYSMELQVSEDTPQAFIMVSADDNVVPVENSLRYASALNENGVPFALHIYPTGGHGWGYGDGFAYKRAWTGELELWLRTCVQ